MAAAAAEIVGALVAKFGVKYIESPQDHQQLQTVKVA
jgi:hypothetical protein